ARSRQARLPAVERHGSALARWDGPRPVQERGARGGAQGGAQGPAERAPRWPGGVSPDPAHQPRGAGRDPADLAAREARVRRQPPPDLPRGDRRALPRSEGGWEYAPGGRLEVAPRGLQWRRGALRPPGRAPRRRTEIPGDDPASRSHRRAGEV